jgi:Protein of unknown function (DUF1592)/Protein of unknown function (DUF1588)/Protein of unknown function (DUF1595)/Protein of unknown function (DUF1587)/Cellulose binding domain/Protein of unknown function (DUF1585)
MNARSCVMAVAMASLADGCGCSDGGSAAAEHGESSATGGSGSEGGSDGGDDGVPAGCENVLPARRVRRLSHLEYDRTIADLVGLELALASGFAPDNVVDGYDNDADALTVSGLLADQYRVAAEGVAEAMLADLGTYLPCDPVSDGETACAQSFVTSFGRRAFRRPLAPDELARFVAIHGEIAAEDGFEEALRWTIAAMLQSPGFLYRSELGSAQDDGTWLLDSHEIASALSYLVIGTMPDAELDADADADLLRDRDVLLAHAERLLAREDAVVPVRAFVDLWLRTGLLEHVTRDAELFPEFTPEIRTAMRGETRRLVDETWRSGGSYADLLLAEHSFLNDELAGFYGVTPGDGAPDAEGFRATTVAGHYGGVLTHGSVVATHSLPQSSSPIHRGLTVRERLLCNDLPPPPPGVVNQAPEIEPGQSTRDRYGQHSLDPACSGCHELLDPIGFGFEHYDAVGRWRAQDAGMPVDASGSIVGTADGDVPFDGAAELATLLADSDEAQRCYAQQWSTFALGGLVQDPGLQCIAEQVGDELIAADLRLDATVLAMVSAPGFITRRDDDAEPPSGDDGHDETSGGEPPGSDTAVADSSTGAPPDDPDVEVTVVQTGLWAEGECNEVTVTNVSDAAVTWEVRFTLQGEINSLWNAVTVADGDDTVFSGAPHNLSIEPAASAQFGFCLAY